MAHKIQIRGDDATAWLASNPILAEREMGIEVDTNRFKFGNGVDTWSALPYAMFRDFEVFDSRVVATPSGGVLLLDLLSSKIGYFNFGSAASAAFTLSFTNDEAMLQCEVIMLITGTVAITMPANCFMYQNEKDGGRWNDSTNILTVVGTTASYFRLIFSKIGSDYLIECSPNFI